MRTHYSLASSIMSTDPTYQAANTVAPIVEAHFARHLQEARRLGEDGLAPQPDARSIAAIINATFWASFRPEEGRFPKISLAYLPPEAARQPMVFEHPLPLTAGVLTKLAPAVERPEIHLGVWNHGDELKVWGTTRSIPSFCFVLEDIEPGLFVVKHRRLNGFGKYANVAVLKGEQVKVIDEKGTSLPDCPSLLKVVAGIYGGRHQWTTPFFEHAGPTKRVNARAGTWRHIAGRARRNRTAGATRLRSRFFIRLRLRLRRCRSCCVRK